MVDLPKSEDVLKIADAIEEAADAPEGTKPWLSKTLWMSVLTCVLPLIPGVGPVASAWIAANPALFTAAVGGAFAGLRLVTNNKISIK